MLLAVDRYYPSSFEHREFLEDHVHAALVCARRLGWRTTVEPSEAADVALVVGAHLPTPRRAGARDVVVNTERLERFVHGNRAAYLDKLREAAGVLCLYADDTALLHRHEIRASTWTYGPDVVPAMLAAPPAPDCDVIHIGSLTDLRARRMRALQESGLRVASAFKLPWLDKCHALGRARAMLALAYDARADYLPWPRIVFARSQGVRCISDVGAHGAFGERWCAAPPDGSLTDAAWADFVKTALEAPVPPIAFDSAAAFEQAVESVRGAP